jgi:hypothetical protein
VGRGGEWQGSPQCHASRGICHNHHAWCCIALCMLAPLLCSSVFSACARMSVITHREFAAVTGNTCGNAMFVAMSSE